MNYFDKAGKPGNQKNKLLAEQLVQQSNFLEASSGEHDNTVISSLDTLISNGSFSIVLSYKPHLHAALNRRMFATMINNKNS